MAQYVPLNPYISLVDLCEELKRPVPDPVTDESLYNELMKAIERGSRWVDEWTGSTYYERDYTLTPLVLDENAPNVFDKRIFMPYSPVVSITSLTWGSSDNPDTLIVDQDFRIGTGINDGVLFRLGDFWRPSWPDGVIKIYGKFGYDQQGDSSKVPTGLPGKIVIATRMVSAALSGHNKKEQIGLDGQKVELATVNNIPKAVFDLLGRKMPILV